MTYACSPRMRHNAVSKEVSNLHVGAFPFLWAFRWGSYARLEGVSTHIVPDLPCPMCKSNTHDCRNAGHRK